MSRPLRIALFVGCFPVVSETFILRQIVGLLERGHHVDIYADTRGASDQPVQPEILQHRLQERTTWMEMPPEVAPYEMPVWPLTGRTWPPGSPDSIPNFERVARGLPLFLRCLVASPELTWQLLQPAEYSYRAASLSGLYRLARLAGCRTRYDVLHAHFGPTANSFRFARQLWNAPLVVSFHGYDFCTVPRKEGAGVYNRLFATADRITVNSEYTRNQLVKLGCPEGKLRPLPVGLEVRAFPFQERTLEPGRPLRLLSIGRLVEIKGHEYVIRAVARLRERQLDVECDLVGDGPLRAKLDGLIRELGLADRVRLCGALDSRALAEHFSRAHILVLASVNVEGDCEGQGLVLQEAQACGLPVIATRHGALPEGLREGRSGFLVPERDAAALADQVADLAANPERWPELGRAGRQYVEEKYDLAKLNPRLVELYREAISHYR